jgi:hypothetical protein
MKEDYYGSQCSSPRAPTYRLWLFLPSLLLGLLNAAIYMRLRRLLPLTIGHWAANALSVLMLAVLPILQ